MFFSLIVPIYNRPDEARELLESLARQTYTNFELVLVEDGSTRPCSDTVEKFLAEITNIHYIVKENSGRSDTRNVGMKNAKGDYFIFFDSDCIIPSHYLETVNKKLQDDYADCFGGPDKEHSSFSIMQKAINYAMTSFWTTGGIRGGKVSMEKFKPRTFNMGFSRAVYEKVGGFKDMYGEDIDHKRRVNLNRFYRQVHIFGQARINLYKLYPDSLRPVYILPALFVIGSITLLILAVFVSRWLFVFPALYLLLLFFDSLVKTKNPSIAGLSIITSFIQIFGYGIGFLKSFVQKIIFHKGLEDSDTLKKTYK